MIHVKNIFIRQYSPANSEQYPLFGIFLWQQMSSLPPTPCSCSDFVHPLSFIENN
ncbi:hypothetical protein FD09_GL001928 [Schleiferilactobacillus perolens DSM 12744]|uniref:Uncharacterized protein n=1 Tax=Schleiferilactobacillus perolens DSM 12744 TaxID=1423792 RepID=A0A0R1N0T0_9LACO|nr:hypothetical protein FD09_GL001928 [Schleiferilactobacillus perolens DSM 12744]